MYSLLDYILAILLRLIWLLPALQKLSRLLFPAKSSSQGLLCTESNLLAQLVTVLCSVGFSFPYRHVERCKGGLVVSSAPARTQVMQSKMPLT